MNAGSVQLPYAQLFLPLVGRECSQPEQSKASNNNRQNSKQIQDDTHSLFFMESVVELFIHKTILERYGGIDPGNLCPDTIDDTLECISVFDRARIESH